VDTKSVPPSTLVAAKETTLAKTFGAPLPSERSVTPATAGGRRSAAKSPSSEAQKYSDAVSPRR
jgi:hypothetical protein